MRINSYSDAAAITHHYDPEIGNGNVYKFWADWPQVLQVLLFGWEKTLNHPAQFHYALDFDGKHLNDAINRTTLTMFGELGLTKGHVLDAGCGIGGASLLLALSNPHVRFMSVTLSKGQIALAQRRARCKGLPNVEYKQANYVELPFKNKEFDGALGIETFCYVPDKEKKQLLAGLLRVLKPGAKLAVFDAYLADKPEIRMHIAHLHTKVFRGWNLPDRISTASYFLATAKKVGFTVVKNEDITKRILACSLELVRRVKFLRTFTPLAKVLMYFRKINFRIPILSEMGLDDPVIFTFADTSELQYDMFKSEDVQFRIIVLKK